MGLINPVNERRINKFPMLGKRKRLPDGDGGAKRVARARPPPMNSVLDPSFLLGMMGHNPVDVLSMILAWRVARPSGAVLAAFNRALCDATCSDWERFKRTEGLCSRRFYSVGLMWQLRAGSFPEPRFVDWLRWSRHHSFRQLSPDRSAMSLEVLSLLGARGEAAERRVDSYLFTESSDIAAAACGTVLRGSDLFSAFPDKSARDEFAAGVCTAIARWGTERELCWFMAREKWERDRKSHHAALRVAISVDNFEVALCLLRKFTKEIPRYAALEGPMIARNAASGGRYAKYAAQNVDKCTAELWPILAAMNGDSPVGKAAVLLATGADRDEIRTAVASLRSAPRQLARVAMLAAPRHGAEFAMEMAREIDPDRSVAQACVVWAAVNGDLDTAMKLTRERAVPITSSLYSAVVERGGSHMHEELLRLLREKEEGGVRLMESRACPSCPHCSAARSTSMANVKRHFRPGRCVDVMFPAFEDHCAVALYRYGIRSGDRGRASAFDEIKGRLITGTANFGTLRAILLAACLFNDVEAAKSCTKRVIGFKLGGHRTRSLREWNELRSTTCGDAVGNACESGAEEILRFYIDHPEVKVSFGRLKRAALFGRAGMVQRALRGWSTGLPCYDYNKVVQAAIRSGSVAIIRAMTGNAVKTRRARNTTGSSKLASFARKVKAREAYDAAREASAFEHHVWEHREKFVWLSFIDRASRRVLFRDTALLMNSAPWSPRCLRDTITRALELICARTRRTKRVSPKCPANRRPEAAEPTASA